MARAMFCVRSLNATAQPTQNKYSAWPDLGQLPHVGQIRVPVAAWTPAEPRNGWPRSSMPWMAAWAVSGKVRLLHDQVAPQVHDLAHVLDLHGARRPRTRCTSCTTRRLRDRWTCPRWAAASCSRLSHGQPAHFRRHLLLHVQNEHLRVQGLPTANAGHTAWQRPHSVQASRSSRSFQSKSRSVLTPSTWPSSIIPCRWAPACPAGSRFRVKMAAGDVNMCIILLNGM